jgi:hypothetical protein
VKAAVNASSAATDVQSAGVAAAPQYWFTVWRCSYLYVVRTHRRVSATVIQHWPRAFDHPQFGTFQERMPYGLFVPEVCA